MFLFNSRVYGIRIFSIQFFTFSFLTTKSLLYAIELSASWFMTTFSVIHQFFYCFEKLHLVWMITCILNVVYCISSHDNKKFSSCGSDRNNIILDPLLQVHKKEIAKLIFTTLLYISSCSRLSLLTHLMSVFRYKET